MARLLRETSGRLLQIVHRVESDIFDTAPQSMAGLLLKEGIYCAFGRSPSDLGASISFDQWLVEDLIPEAAGTDSKWVKIGSSVCHAILNILSSQLSYNTPSYRLARGELGRRGSATNNSNADLFPPHPPHQSQ